MQMFSFNETFRGVLIHRIIGIDRWFWKFGGTYLKKKHHADLNMRYKHANHTLTIRLTVALEGQSNVPYVIQKYVYKNTSLKDYQNNYMHKIHTYAQTTHR